MNICLLGPGFVGRTVGLQLSQHPDFHVTLTSSRANQIDEGFDVIVNCAGASRRYLVEQDPKSALSAEYLSFKRILLAQDRRPQTKLLHISSICAQSPEDSEYGKLKYEVEKWARTYPNICILRLGGLVGPGLQKNLIYDWTNQKPLRVTPKSFFNFITTQEVGRIVDQILQNWLPGETINVGASTSMRASTIVGLRKIKYSYLPEDLLVHENNRIDIARLQEFFTVKTTEHYLETYLRWWEKQSDD